MLLDKIRARGFLSHFGSEGGGFNEVDLRDSPLWLAHGPNGAGKSAFFFDALSLALYGEHRGGRNDTDSLIHSDADEAVIEVEFTMGPERYCVQCVLRRKSPKKSHAVRRWTGHSWTAVGLPSGGIEGWARETLRMSFPTFASSVLLRQGEADVFLKTKPTARRQLLMELVDLTFYKRLGEAAVRRRQAEKDARERIERMASAIADADDGHLEEAQASADAAKAELEAAWRRHEGAVRTLDDARRAAALEAERAAQQTALIAHDAALADAARIENELRRFYDLQASVPALQALHRARAILAREEADRDAHIAEKATCEAMLDAQAREMASVAEARREADAAREAAEVAWHEATAQERQAGVAAEELARIEEVELQIAQAEAALAPHFPLLAAAGDIEQAAVRLEALQEALPLLHALSEADAKAEHASAVLAEAEAEVHRAAAAFAAAEAALEAARADVDEQDSLYKSRLEDTRRLTLHVDVLRRDLARHQGLEGHAACTHCGARLDTDEAKARLAAENARLEREIGEREREVRQLGLLAGQSGAAFHEAGQRRDAAEHEARSAQDRLVRGRTLLDGARTGAATDLDALDRARAAAGPWAGQLGTLAMLEAEAKELVRGDRRAELAAARGKQAAVDAVLKALRAQLSALPHLDEAARFALRSRASDVATLCGTAHATYRAAAAAADDARAAEGALREEMTRLRALRDAAALQANVGVERAAVAAAELEARAAEVPAPWRDHAAFADAVTLDGLASDLTSLARAPEQALELDAARREGERVRADLRRIERDLDAVPVAHRRDPDEAEAEEAYARAVRADAEEVRARAGAALAAAQDRRRQRDGLLEQAASAAVEARRFERLAEAFGPKGLQALVLQGAQSRLHAGANDTLGKLSGGNLQLELDDVDGERIDIKVCDLTQPGRPGRDFEYLSGGEKFRVAVALAVGIGQCVTGGRPADTLFIDEGFGALDDANRALMVEELVRLRDKVFDGNGRVVVVSHQDDVMEAFEHRVRVSRGDDGRARVEVARGSVC